MVPANVQEIPENIQGQLAVGSFQDMVMLPGDRPFTLRDGRSHYMDSDFAVFPQWPKLNTRGYQNVLSIANGVVGNGTVKLHHVASGITAGFYLLIKGDQGEDTTSLGELIILEWKNRVLGEGLTVRETIEQVAKRVGAL